MSRISRIGEKIGIKNAGAVLKDLQLMTVKQGVAVICGLALMILFARRTDKETFGLYTLIISIIGTMAFTALPGLNNFVIKATARGEEGYFIRSLYWSVAGAAVGGIALIAARVCHLEIVSGLSYPLVFLIASLFPFYLGFDTWESYLMGTRRFASLAKLDSLRILTVSLCTGLAVYTQQSLSVIVIAFIGTTSVFNLCYSLLVARMVIRKQPDTSAMRPGIVLSLINFIPFASSSLDRILVSTYLGPSVLADYAIASALSDTVRSHLKIILSALFPRIAARETHLNFRLLFKNAWIPVALGSIFAAISWFLAPYVIPFAFGAKYADTVWLTQLMTLTIVLRPINRLLYSVIVFDESLWINFMLNTLPTLLRLSLYPFLLPTYGIAVVVPAIIIEELIFLLLGAHQMLRTLRTRQRADDLVR